LLGAARDGPGRMTRQIGKLDDKPGESRARPTRCRARPSAQLTKERIHQTNAIGRQAVTDMLETVGRQLFIALKHGGEQIVLAAKIRIDRPLGQASPFRD